MVLHGGAFRIASSAIGAALVAAMLLPAGPAQAADAPAYSWGINPYGQLGRGSISSTRQLPARIPALSAAGAVAAGREHALALAGGQVYGWGLNQYGAVGDGTTTNRGVPTAVSGVCPGSSVRDIATGHYHSLALCSNGTVNAWGRNQDGQLGNGNAVQQARPVAVRNISTAIQVAGGQYFSLALLAGGTVWAWGVNVEGELGNGTTAGSYSPVQVQGLPTTVVAVIAGRNQGLARTSNGDLYAWGSNVDGQVGDGTTTNRLRAVRVLTGVAQIGAGGFHSLAVKTDGSLWAWGLNASGQLGIGTTSNAHAPVRVGSLTSWKSVSGGRDDSFAIRTDGSLYGWGSDYTGQLGDGNTGHRTTPGQVSGVSAVRMVGAGNDFSVVLAG